MCVTFLNVSLMKNLGGAAAPPQAMKCQNKEINADLTSANLAMNRTLSQVSE